MQMMSWVLARLGSRFSLLFEPHHKRVRYCGGGRVHDQPIDLMVGVVEPDGTERVLPFSDRAELLTNCEQFERLNSITFRGYSERYRLKYEFNLHSVFYPQNEPLCTVPAFYMEMRIAPVAGVRGVRGIKPAAKTPDKVKLFIRLAQQGTEITATGDHDGHPGRIDLSYQADLMPPPSGHGHAEAGTARFSERIVSLNPGCVADTDGAGLTLELPVTNDASGIKWRLVWAAHCADPVMASDNDPTDAHDGWRLRYLRDMPTLDDVVDHAIARRDDSLAHSRRLEKLMEQVPLSMTQRHLLNQSFQNFLCNTLWCDRLHNGETDSWFSVWDSAEERHSPVTTQYTASMLYLAMWPGLLVTQFDQWASMTTEHTPSGGACLAYPEDSTAAGHWHDAHRPSPLVENADLLLLLQAYTHWTGDLSAARRHAQVIKRLADYLIWTDRDGTGFPTEQPGDTLTGRPGGVKTYTAVKRAAGLQAAADLMSHLDGNDFAQRCDDIVQAAMTQVEARAWLSDHYAVSVDTTHNQPGGVWLEGEGSLDSKLTREGYAINTGNALLLPALTSQPLLLDQQFLMTDLRNAAREMLGVYGCRLSSVQSDLVSISQNLWRDYLARYLGSTDMPWGQRYWDLQVMSNTGQQSLGYADQYISGVGLFHSVGAAAFGCLMAYPRLIVDWLAPGGARISVNPDRHYPQRWPLFPLADWRAGKIPVCVIDATGNVTIEGETDPVIIHGSNAATTSVIG